jgi:hypothetical protein
LQGHSRHASAARLSLVKGLLAIPRLIALSFLWIAFAVVINRATVHQLPALPATTGDLT